MICENLHGNLIKTAEQNFDAGQEICYLASFAVGLELTLTKNALAI